VSIGEAVERAARDHPDLVADAGRQRPGAWGALAAQGILAFRELAGRRPSAAERRAIWSGLWSHVIAPAPRSCGHAIDEHEHALCAVCHGLRLCLACARRHLCLADCRDAGCVPGGCVHLVRGGSVSESFGLS